MQVNIGIAELHASTSSLNQLNCNNVFYSKNQGIYGILLSLSHQNINRKNKMIMRLNFYATGSSHMMLCERQNDNEVSVYNNIIINQNSPIITRTDMYI